MITRKLSLLALVLTTSCASVSEELPRCASYEFRVAPEIEPRLVTAIDSARQTWSTILAGKFQTSMVVTSDAKRVFQRCVVEVTYGDEGNGEAFASGQHTSEGAGVLKAGTLTINGPLVASHLDDDVFLRSLFLHEIGHNLGLVHDTDRSHETIMWPYIGHEDNVGCVDVTRVCVVWGCQPACAGAGWAE